MGKVFVDVGMSLDGFIAGPNGGPGNPLGDGGMRIHQWAHRLAAFRARLGMTGGADVIQQYLEAGVVDELAIHLAPVVLGKGVPLFGRVAPDRFALGVRDTSASPLVTHLAYRLSYPPRSARPE